MNDAVTLSPLKFGIGQPVHRKEDPRLVRGEGRYADDIALPGQASARVVRSAHAHGLLRRIDVAAALALPGVLAAAWVTSPRRRDRLADASAGGSIRTTFAHGVAGLVMVRSLARQPRQHLPGLVGVAFFCLGDMVCLWAALNAFSCCTWPMAFTCSP